MKRRGRYSVENSGRVIKPVEAPDKHHLRDRIAQATRDAFEQTIPDVDEEDVTEEDKVLALEGIVRALAEMVSFFEAHERRKLKQHLMRVFEAEVQLAVQNTHRRTVNASRPETEKRLKFTDGGKLPDTMDSQAVFLQTLKPVYDRFRDAAEDSVRRTMRTTDPMGSSIMAIYGLLEVASVIVRGAPEERQSLIAEESRKFFYSCIYGRNKARLVNEVDSRTLGEVEAVIEPRELPPLEADKGLTSQVFKE